MSVQLSYPGVYVEELPSAAHTIVGVATSIAVFVDSYKWGPVNTPIQLLGLGDLDRELGGLDVSSEGSYAIQQFFLNGGGEAWAVRVVGQNALAANVTLADKTSGGTASLVVSAISQGAWGGADKMNDGLRVRIDASTTVAGQFNMTVSLHASTAGQDRIVRQEVFRELSMKSTDPNYFATILGDKISGSSLVTATAGGSASPPAPNGTVTPSFTNPISIQNPHPEVTVVIDGVSAVAKLVGLQPSGNSTTDVAVALEAAIQIAKSDSAAFARATVTVQGNTIVIFAGPAKPTSIVSFQTTANDATTLADLQLDKASANVQEYQLGQAAGAGAQLANGQSGANGDPPKGNDLMGTFAGKTGIYALENMDLFNILSIPRTAVVSGANALSASEAQAVLSAAEAYCASRRAMLLVDTPNNVVTPTQIKAWLGNNDGLRDKNAVLYYPRVQVPDPLNNFVLRSIGASGTIAGLYARIDAARGVWKAPAGTEASLRNVSQLDYVMTDPENGTLNPLAINCIRTFPVYGTICWGARTLDGADARTSEWKYVPVRRLALFLEESLYRGTKWVVFEPNDEPLWAQIRLNLTAFMQGLFRKGAFQGTTPKEAYFVKCDRETTTQDDIDQGIVNIVVGFAPLKPAEFVVIQIQQITGQTAV